MAIFKLGMPVLVLMENAGLRVAGLARQLLGGSVSGKKIVVLVGSGHNGGDGLAAARHLISWGGEVVVVSSGESKKAKKVTKKQFYILTQTKTTILVFSQDKRQEIEKILKSADLIIDGLLGYGLKSSPRGEADMLIKLANKADKDILAIDTPSGFDTDQGKEFQPCIQAKWTVSLGALKAGLLTKAGQPPVGQLYLADIGFPQEAFKRAGVKSENVFERESAIKIEKLIQLGRG